MSDEQAWQGVLSHGSFDEIQRAALGNMQWFSHYTHLFDLKRMHRFCTAVDVLMAEHEMTTGVHAGLSDCYDPRGLHKTLVEHELWPFYLSERSVSDLEGEAQLVHRVQAINQAQSARPGAPEPDFATCDICGFHHFISSAKRKFNSESAPDLRSNAPQVLFPPPQ